MLVVAEASPYMNQHGRVLEGLRGLAILAVVVCHVNDAYGGSVMVGRLAGPLAMMCGWGWGGVDLFGSSGECALCS